MADHIRLTEDSVIFVEETFGGLETAELTVDNDELGEYEVHFDVEGSVPLDEFVTTQESGEFELDLTSFRTGTVEIREVDAGEEEDVRELTQSLEQTMRSNMPPIPDDDGLETPTDEAHYRRLVRNADSQPATYRRLIRNEGEIDRPRFDRWAERQGFEPETGGSHGASLLMLDRIGEIDRRGRGDDQVIVWIGE